MRASRRQPADDTSLIASGLDKDLPKLLDLLADAALHPTFPEDELAKHKKQAISALVEGKQRPATLAANLARQTALRHRRIPTARYPTEESVGGLHRATLVNFHAQYFSPDNATLAVVGDLHADDVVPLVEKAFARLEGAPRHGREPADVSPTCRPRRRASTVHLVDRPGSVQSNIVVCGAASRATTTTRPNSACSTRSWAVVSPGGCSRTCARNTDTPTGRVRVFR